MPDMMAHEGEAAAELQHEDSRRPSVSATLEKGQAKRRQEVY